MIMFKPLKINSLITLSDLTDYGILIIVLFCITVLKLGFKPGVTLILSIILLNKNGFQLLLSSSVPQVFKPFLVILAFLQFYVFAVLFYYLFK